MRSLIRQTNNLLHPEKRRDEPPMLKGLPNYPMGLKLSGILLKKGTEVTYIAAFVGNSAETI